MTYDSLQEGYRTGSPFDLAKHLGDKGITRLLEIVCEAYTTLYRNRIVKPQMSEDEITEELFKEVNIAWSASSVPPAVVPINQKIDREHAKDRGKPPTIDFCFRDRWEKEAFFGFECKLLAEGNSRSYREYIKQGLYRYIEGRYCANGTVGSLIGYINTGRIAVIVKEIKTRVDKERIVEVMTLASSVSAFREHYVSTHLREKDRSPFRIHHLFFSFVELK
ncbi:MAG: hypothetical protein WED05_05660 [Candidatus Atabeyarchaeum deiterrae]